MGGSSSQWNEHHAQTKEIEIWYDAQANVQKIKQARANKSMKFTSQEDQESLYIDPTVLLTESDDPITLISQTCDTMNRHEALREPYKEKFLKAIASDGLNMGHASRDALVKENCRSTWQG